MFQGVEAAPPPPTGIATGGTDPAGVQAATASAQAATAPAQGGTPADYTAVAQLIASDPSFVDYIRRIVIEAATTASQAPPLNPNHRFEQPPSSPRYNPELGSTSYNAGPSSRTGNGSGPRAVAVSVEAMQAAEAKYELAMNELRALRLVRDVQAVNFRLTAQSMSDSPYQTVQNPSPENLARAELAYAATLSELNDLRRNGPRDPPGSRPIQLPKLAMYSGDTMRGESCENWTLEALNWVRNQETFIVRRLLTEPEKIDAVGAHMTGRANNMWLFWQARRLSLDPSAPTTLVGFLSNLRKQYTSIDSAEVRRRRFDTLRQVTSVREFVYQLSDLRSLMDPVPGDEEFRQRLTLGVKDKVRREILKQPIRPPELNDFIQWIIRIDEALMQELRASQAVAYPRRGSLPPYREVGRTRSHEGQLNAMDETATHVGMEVDGEQDDQQYPGEEETDHTGDLNAVQSASRFMRGRGGRGTSRGRSGYRGTTSGRPDTSSNKGWTDDGHPICYVCGEPGHLARNCSSKGTSQ
jgi:hypothetical protein